MENIEFYILVLIIIILAIILVYSMMMGSKKKQYFTRIDELDYRRYEISNKTVPFELAKLKSTKKSERIVSKVTHWEKQWGALEEQFVALTEQIIAIEVVVEKRDFDIAQKQLDEVSEKLDQLEQAADSLLEEIRTLKRSEERSRSNIIGLKDQFEIKKTEYEEKELAFRDYQDEIKQLFVNIEQLFLSFNLYMEECNYDEADEAITEIKESLSILTRVFERTPIYVDTVEKKLMPLVKEVLKSYQTISVTGVYLEHLEIESTIENYKLKLSTFRELIKTFDFEKIEETLLEIETNAKQMIQYMKYELELKETLHKKMYATEEKLEQVKRGAEHLDKRYESIKDNYMLLEEEEHQFHYILNEVQSLQNEMNYCMTRFKEKQTPSSALHQELDALLTQLTEVETQLQIVETDIKNLYAGEKKCRQDALQLLYVLNRAKSHHDLAHYTVFPHQINHQLSDATHQMMSLLESLDEVPVNILEVEERLEKIRETVTNTEVEVEKQVQQLKLAEALIVYGHRYIIREGMYVVDLTIAEDQFRQGNYSNVIESMKRILTSVEGHEFSFRFTELKQSLDCYLL